MYFNEPFYEVVQFLWCEIIFFIFRKKKMPLSLSLSLSLEKVTQKPWFHHLHTSFEELDVSGLCNTVKYDSSFSNKLKAVETFKD